MQFRQLYKCVGEKGLNYDIDSKVWGSITEEEVCKFVEDDGYSEKLKPEEIAIRKYKIHHGMKKDHPINYVKFFDRKGEKKEAYYLMKSKLESLIPKNC